MVLTESNILNIQVSNKRKRLSSALKKDTKRAKHQEMWTDYIANSFERLKATCDDNGCPMLFTYKKKLISYTIDDEIVKSDDGFTIGRELSNEICLNDDEVSGFHAKITFDEANQAYYIHDKESSNGTLINNADIESHAPVELKLGDEITFGSVSFTWIAPPVHKDGNIITMEEDIHVDAMEVEIADNVEDSGKENSLIYDTTTTTTTSSSEVLRDLTYPMREMVGNVGTTFTTTAATATNSIIESAASPSKSISYSPLVTSSMVTRKPVPPMARGPTMMHQTKTVPGSACKYLTRREKKKRIDTARLAVTSMLSPDSLHRSTSMQNEVNNEVIRSVHVRKAINHSSGSGGDDISNVPSMFSSESAKFDEEEEEENMNVDPFMLAGYNEDDADDISILNVCRKLGEEDDDDIEIHNMLEAIVERNEPENSEVEILNEEYDYNTSISEYWAILSMKLKHISVDKKYWLGIFLIPLVVFVISFISHSSLNDDGSNYQFSSSTATLLPSEDDLVQIQNEVNTILDELNIMTDVLEARSREEKIGYVNYVEILKVFEDQKDQNIYDLSVLMKLLQLKNEAMYGGTQGSGKASKLGSSYLESTVTPTASSNQNGGSSTFLGNSLESMSEDELRDMLTKHVNDALSKIVLPAIQPALGGYGTTTAASGAGTVSGGDLHGVTEDYVLDIVGRTLEASDGVNRVDFASQAVGGFVVPGMTTNSNLKHNYYDNVLLPDNSIGKCWKLPATNGMITVKLPKCVRVDAISIDSASPLVLNDKSTIPREVSVEGFRSMSLTENEEEDVTIYRDATVESWDSLLPNIEFDILGSMTQTFNVDSNVLSNIPQSHCFDAVRFHFKSNYGNADTTCVYRVRVHGSTTP